MKPRESNPEKYRDNVRKSWLVMREVVSQINDTCYIAHLEPNPGVGYDCLSLVANDLSGFDTEHHGILRSKFMLNRNGQNGFIGGEVISNIWEIASSDSGIKKLANDLIELSGLSRIAIGRSKSVSVQVCDVVTDWIERHSESEFCVSSPGWPGGCRVFEQSCNFTDSTDPTSWPSSLGEPYLSLGIRYSEVARVRMTDAKIKSMGENMESNYSKAEQLALSIATCAEIKTACNDKNHPCNLVVMSQEKSGTSRQSPEPWVGNLEKAPLIFISSNPSISTATSEGELFPKVNFDSAEADQDGWTPVEIVDFHTKRFDQNRQKPYVRVDPMVQYLCNDGNYRGRDGAGPGQQSQKFWRDAIKVSSFIFKKEIDISSDICFTEVVHCKSKTEANFVESAMPRCSENYLIKILELSNASMAICYGAASRKIFQELEMANVEIDIDKSQFGRFNTTKPNPGANHLGVISVNGRKIIFCALKHSNGHGEFGKHFENALGIELAGSLANLFASIRDGSESVPGSRNALLERLNAN